MDWSAVQTGLVAAVRLAMDAADYDVGWADRESRWRSAAGCVRLSPLSFTRRGRDERRYSDEGDFDLQERIYGVRRLTVQFLVEAQDQDLADSAAAIAERIVAGLRRSDVEDLLVVAGIGVATIGETRQINAPDEHDRVRSIWAFDVAFNAHTSIEGPVIPAVLAVEYAGDITNGPDIPATEINHPDYNPAP